MNLLQASEIMRRGEKIPRRQQAGLVIALSVPAILEQLVSTLMSYIDTAMVGSLGYFATASIGVVASTTWLLSGLVSAAAVGFSVQVAQYLGAGRERDSRDVLCQAILFNAAFGAALAVLAVLAGQFLPAALGAEAALRPYARAYFCTVAAFLPFSMACAFYSSILRCSGSVVLPSVLNVGMCLLDMLFNFFLIYPTRQIGGVTVWGAGLGVTGAALGTGLAQACIGLMLLFLVLRRRGPLRLRGGERWRFTRPCMRSALQLATPAALERLALCLAQIVMTAVVTGMGPVAVAANYVAVQTESICYLPAYGIATAATALVGQSIGAGRQDMAKRFAYGTTALGFGLVTVMGGLLFWLAPVLSGLLTPEAEVIDLSARALRIVAFSEPLFAVSIVAIGALRGAGDGKGPFLINAFSMWVLRVLPVLLLTRAYGVIGVWATMTAELVARGLLCFWRLYRGRWLSMSKINF